MGMVYTEITLQNYDDITDFDKKRIVEKEIRQATVTAVVDTGAMYMVINEELSQKLGLRINGETTAHIANGQSIKCKLIEAVKVQWKNRHIVVPAIIIPGSKKILFGAMALEGMDLMVNPVNQEVVGAHGDKVECYAL